MWRGSESVPAIAGGLQDASAVQAASGWLELGRIAVRHLSAQLN